MRTRGPRLGVTSRMIILAAVAVGFVGTGAYFCFSAPFGNQFPFACSIPALPTTQKEIKASRATSQPARENVVREPVAGSEEIADMTGQGETLLSLLSANLPDTDSAARVAARLVPVISPEMKKRFTAHTVLPESKRYRLILDAEGRFLKATLELDPDKVFHAVKEGDRIRAWKEEVVLDFKVETVCFPVKGSLRQSVLNAGEGRDLAGQLQNVFKWDIDFQSESIRGDTCKVLFKRRYADDRPAGYGDILCAVYNGKKTGKKVAIRFNDVYYDEKGVELKKNFLRSPLQVIRVTSKYGNRFHPILKVWRRHKGVDYGAAVGTPVWSVAKGVVTFAGRQRGYGKYVCIKHDNGFESRYGHLHRIFVRKGQRVGQRHRIGTVGQTGLATGPHLDFQLLRNGKHRDPLRVKMVKSLRSVAAPLKPRFRSIVQQRLLSLEGIILGNQTATTTTARIN